ncbi:unnamed protein product [Peronospora belbahrii]|uniref:CAP-Gly domain-containing protein n=1 Tax=Peronospora belbahrii TaxID=622444 RepID=A0AAU9KHG7_9STRA|nr:unnamed protein product [Peronospora belbahrii]
MADDMRALRSFVTAMDGHQYDNIPKGVVCLLITHSNLKLQMVDIRLDLHSTIGELRHKIYQHTGTKPDAMELLIMHSDGSVYSRLDDDQKKLGFYSVQNGMRLHVVDKDPFSLSRGGGLEDVSLVKKYEISEEDYNMREKTVRAYKREQLAKDPKWKPKPMMNVAKPAADPSTFPDSESVANMKFDEPVGKGNGSVKGVTYFKCKNKYGGFVRPHNVVVGDFQVLDPFADMSDDDDEL